MKIVEWFNQFVEAIKNPELDIYDFIAGIIAFLGLKVIL